MHCLQMYVLDATKNKLMLMYVLNLVQTKLHVLLMFWLFVSVQLQHLLCLFSLVMFLCTVIVCSTSAIFVWS